MLPPVEAATTLEQCHGRIGGYSKTKNRDIVAKKQPPPPLTTTPSASVPTIMAKSPPHNSNGNWSSSSSDAANGRNRRRTSPQHHQQQQQPEQTKKGAQPHQQTSPSRRHHRRNLSSSSTNSNSSNHHSHYFQQLPHNTTTANNSSSHSGSSSGSFSNNSNSTASSSANNNIVVSSFSNLATQAISLGRYRQAFEHYQLALQDYLSKGGGGGSSSSIGSKTEKESGHHKRSSSATTISSLGISSASTLSLSRITVVDLVNAAATCFNLGALAKKLHDFPQAAGYFLQAQDMYQRSAAIVEQCYQSSAATSSPSQKEWKNDINKNEEGTMTTASSSSTSSCQVCLLMLLVETLQARAHLHYKYQGLVENAIECHEEVVELLEATTTSSSVGGNGVVPSPSRVQERDFVYMNKIHFTILSKSNRLQLLVTSMQLLGKLYVERGELDDAIVAYQEALSILKELDDTNIEPTEQRQDEVCQILRALSDVFLHQDTWESKNDIVQLERLALVQEDLEDWDKAMQCWERILYCQSQEHGEESIQVSRTLSQLSRVMILEGNLEGALDLYQAAANIVLKTTPQVPLPEELISQILALYMELNQGPNATAWLRMLLSKNRSGLRQQQRKEEEARIHLELGRLYLDQGLFAAASEALCLSVDLSNGKDERAFELLQKVEFLKHTWIDGGVSPFDDDDEVDEIEGNNSTISSGSPTSRAAASSNNETSALTAIAEDGESALITEEDSDIGGVKFVNTSPSQDQSDLMGSCAISASSASALDVTLGSLAEKKAKALLEEEEELLDALVIGATQQHANASAVAFASAGKDDEAAANVVVRAVQDIPASMPDVVNLSDQSSLADGSAAAMGNRMEGESATTDHHDDDDDVIVTPQPATRPSSNLDDDVGIVETRARSAAENPAETTKSAIQAVKLSPNRHKVSQTQTNDDTRLYSKRTEILVYVSDDSSADESVNVGQKDERSSAAEASEADTSTHQDAIIDCTDFENDDAVVHNRVLLIEDDSPIKRAGDEDDEVYESFKRQHDNSSLEVDEGSPVVGPPTDLADDTDDSPSPLMMRANSRTALLKPIEKVHLPQKSQLNMPTLTSPKNAAKNRGRRGYAEVPDRLSTSSQRRRIVKALANPFRRSRSKSSSRAGNELDPLDEDKEVEGSLPVERKVLEEEATLASDAPVSFVNMRNSSDDDAESLVSQITFRMDEPAPKKNEKEIQWWWGVTAEGLEGWFPSSYVHQAVEAAEGFLSAKAIHDRVKSRPLDFDSDEESDAGEEDISLIKDTSSKQSKTKQSLSAETSKFASAKPLDPSSQTSSRRRNISIESELAKPSLKSSSSSAVATSLEVNKNLPLETQIKDKELQLETTKAMNGFDDIAVATVQIELAAMYMTKNDHGTALELCRAALKIQKASVDLADACRTLHMMADLHSRQTRYKEALSCYSEAQRLQEATYGYFHEEIADTLNRIGNVLARQGEFDLAMENHREALRILKECCGENVKHPLVSQTLIHIGAVYYKERNSLATIQSKVDGYSTFIEGGMLEIIGRAHEDRGSYRMAIAFFEEKLQFLNDGENSSDLEDVAETLNSLGMLSCRAGLYLEAIDYYDRALGIQMKLGCDDVQLAMARVLAGSVQYSLGHFNKALKLFQEALDTLRRQVGPEQESVAATLFHMGVVEAALCKYDDAMANLRDALDLQSRLLGIDHPATCRTRREIGNLYAVYESEVDAAFEEFNDILELQKQIHGDKHPNVAETLHSIGCAQARKGDLNSALRTLEDCYNMRLEFLGMDHPQQATTLHEIAKIQLQRGRLKKAIHIIDAALNIRVESLSEQHIDVALAMATKGSCLVARGNFADASKLFNAALPIAKAAVGDMHPSVAGIRVQIGILHLRKCHFEEASGEIREALAIYRHSDLDEDHPGIREAAEELERVERAEMLCV